VDEPAQIENGSQPNAPRRVRCCRCCLAVVAALALLIALGLALVRGGPEHAVTPFAGQVPTAVAQVEATVAGVDADGDGLEDVTERALASRYAPRFRFNAYDPAHPGRSQNLDERYFPMSVARFLTGLDRGVFMVEGSAGKGETVQTAKPGRFEHDRVVGFPSRMVGDPLGTAPVYTHVYPLGNGDAVIEYWLFYAYDRADASFLGIDVPHGDHRCDWEHTAYRVKLDPPRLLEGYYYGHGTCLLVPGEDLELAEATHPLVYVSQGKHASYPTACRLESTPFPRWFVQHDDQANGRGLSWDSWGSPLIDLGERGKPRVVVVRWQGFLGRWGEDGVYLGPVGVDSSPTGPLAKSSWRNNGAGVPWREHLRDRGAELYGAR
jgi:hypothetical protein